MADTKISADPTAGAFDGTEIIPVVQAGANKKSALSALKTWVLTGLTLAWSSITGTPTTLSGYGITDAASSSALSTHTGASTSVHGIADTSKLQTYGRTTFSNADATISAGTHYLAQIGTMSAARTVTLPAASAVPVGFELIIGDESGSVTSTNTIIITRAGSDTVNGGTSTALNTAYGRTTLISDGTSKWTLATSATTLPAIITGDKGVMFDDIFNVTTTGNGGPFGMFTSNGGSGSTPSATNPPDASAPGIIQLPSGSGSTGRCGYFCSPVTLRFGSLAQSVTWRFQLPTLLDGTESGAIYVGFLDSATVAPADGAYIYWDNTQANFRYRTRSNSVETDADSGLAPVAATWYAATVSINAAGTLASFSVEANNSRATALTNANAGTISTNIPTASGRDTGLGINMIKSAGTTSRILYVDYVRYAWG